MSIEGEENPQDKKMDINENLGGGEGQKHFECSD